jgi:TonB family protein
MQYCGGAILLIAIAAQGVIFAQSFASSEMPKGSVVLISLFNPTYPELARRARVQGDVNLKLEIRRDGSIDSVVVMSGHPLLEQAAVNSAQQSRFECRGCEDETTPYLLVYSFQFVASPDFPCPEKIGLRVTHSQNHVTVMTEPAVIHILFASIPVRSAKCLYLWKCGSRWGGNDYYYDRVRSLKCLNIWKCDFRLREPYASCKRLNRHLAD